MCMDTIVYFYIEMYSGSRKAELSTLAGKTYKSSASDTQPVGKTLQVRG